MTVSRGQLRIYLGAAPGVGKTYAMLEEAHRRADRGTDVVVGFVETHGRPHTEAMLGDLEVVPRRTVTYRGADVHRDGPRRRPGPAPRGRPGRRAGPHQRARLPQRQALAGHRGAARRRHHRAHHGQHPAPGVAQRRRRSRSPASPQRETVPDEVVRRAEQVELVDMTPEALRRRMAHGNIYRPDKVDAALRQLLPGRQPHRPARAGPAVAGRQGRRPARPVPRRPRHRPTPGRPANGSSSR